MGPFPFRLGGFGTVVIDPPWDFDDQAGRMKLPYQAMTDQDILALPVNQLAADKSHLYCWTTDSHIELALHCVRRWGFDFKTTIVWVKMTDDGKRLRIGGGHYVRKSHELCLMGVRNQVGIVHDIPSVIFAPRGEHSAKPEQLQDLAERLSPAPRVEIFARRRRENWMCWGNEVDRAAG